MDITVAHAIGISAIVSLVALQFNKDTTRDPEGYLAYALTFPAVVLLVGWLAHLAM